MASSSLLAAFLLVLGCSSHTSTTSTRAEDERAGAAGKSGATSSPATGGGQGESGGNTSEPAAGESGKGDGGNAGSGGGNAASGGGSFTPLTDHELFLVGVWRGTISDDDQEFSYFVLQPDRTGCAWDRHGTNFSQRFYAFTFSDWQLEETPLDADERMTLRFVVSTGETQSIERYDAATDRIFIGGYLATRWLDLLIPCDSVGTNATQTEVERQGTAPPKP